MGPLAGVRVVEMAGIGPCPFCGTLLSDMGADVIRVERPGMAAPAGRNGALSRGRRSLALDLRQPGAAEAVLRLVERADILIEGYRPGVMERLGLGPETCLARNPGLVYGRVTGWGQEGPLAPRAGHDINFVALSGALHAIGPRDGPPLPPLNLVGDMGGGGMLLAFGVACALLEARRSGRGQVVDAAMVDGAAQIMGMIYGLLAEGHWQDRRGSNLLDGGAARYGCYRCADGRWLAVGALEPVFLERLLGMLGIDVAPAADDAALRAALAKAFARRPRHEWQALLEGEDVCVTPVLDLAEAPLHPHNSARGTFVRGPDGWQPAAAPRFSRTPAEARTDLPVPGADTDAILADIGFSPEEIITLKGNVT